MKLVNMLALLLVIIGGLNWALAVFDFNLVSFLLGRFGTTIVNAVYIAVGVGALICIPLFKKL
jgi:uncharacterized membrane protein YuzA (DUF378 family)